MPPPRNAPDFTIYLVRAALFLIYGLPCAIGTWWLVLFTRKPVVAQFVAAIPVPLALASALSPYPSLPGGTCSPGPACTARGIRHFLGDILALEYLVPTR